MPSQNVTWKDAADNVIRWLVPCLLAGTTWIMLELVTHGNRLTKLEETGVTQAEAFEAEKLHQQTIAELRETMAAIRTDLRVIQDQLTRVRQDVDEIKQDVAALQAQVQTLGGG